MTPMTNHKRLDEEGQAIIEELLQERLRLAFKYNLVQVLEEAVDEFVNAAPYQRTPKRHDQHNGRYERDLVTTMGVIEDIPVPRMRNGLRTELFERYQRRHTELDEAILEMFVGGVSTARVGEVVNALSGVNLGPSTVSRIFHSLDEEFQSWKSRPLQKRYLYVFADGACFTVICGEENCKMPIFAVIGIDKTGMRGVLAFTVGEQENQHAWEDQRSFASNRPVSRRLEALQPDVIESIVKEKSDDQCQ